MTSVSTSFLGLERGAVINLYLQVAFPQWWLCHSTEAIDPCSEITAGLFLLL